MASILKVDSIGKTSGSTQDTMAGMAKVRCRSNQRNAQYAIIESFNTSSITDESGVGQSTMGFTNNFANANFSYSGSCGDEGIGATNDGAVLRLEDNAQTTSTSGNVETLSMTTNISVDTPIVNYIAFGDLA